jgi:hypothetical protein
MAKDIYSQLAYLEVVESAANTLTFAGMSVFSNVLSQRGMLLHRVLYTFSETQLAKLANSGDGLAFGLCGDDQMDSVSPADARVYDSNRVMRIDMGAAATGHMFHCPFMRDFTDLPGSGMLVPADRLFGYVKGISLGSALEIWIRVHYTLIDMGAQDYLELAQAMRVLR